MVKLKRVWASFLQAITGRLPLLGIFARKTAEWWDRCVTPDRARYVSIAMLALTVIMLVYLCCQLGGHVIWRRGLPPTLAECPATTQTAETQPTQKPSAKPTTLAAAITKRNIFAKPKPTGHGLSLTGVLGNIALFATREGQTIGIQEGQAERGIKVVSIQSYEVTVEYEGKSETMKLFAGPGAKPGAEPGPRPGMPLRVPPGGPGAEFPDIHKLRASRAR